MGTQFCRLVAGAALLLLLAEPVRASITRFVTNLNDSGAGSLRDAIAISGSGDTINFSVTGTITLTTASLNVGHNLTIQGPGVNSLTITRQSSSAFRIFSFGSGTSTLSDVTVSNGSDSVTSGGIYNGGNLTLTNCVVSGNSAGQRAGGIGNDGTLTMNNCFVINNQSGGPGGVDGGGGIFNAATGTLTLHDCTLSNNGGASTGGAIASEGTLTVTTSTFNDNTGPGAGAIYMAMASGQDSTIQNCTFSHNTGVSTVRHAGDATVTVQSCTFTGDDVGAAGSIYAFSGASVVRIGNTILNDAASFFIKNGAIISLGYNLSRDDGGGLLTATGDQINTDPKLDPYGLQYNGGYTDTFALTYGSPAIDKGKSFGLTSDQRGLARTYDNPNFPNASGGDGTDIGAYEAPSDPLEYGLIVTTTSDHDDGSCGSDCTLREAIARAESLSADSSPVISFAIGLNGTVTLNHNPFPLTITRNMNIVGPGARFVAISANFADRVLNVTGGPVTISGVTIRDGNYFTNQDHGETRQGGAVFNQAILTFNDCEFVNNTINGASNINNGGNGGTGQGGAIYNQSHLTLNRCTFSGNSAIGAAGNTFASSQLFGAGGNGGAGQGGGLFNDSSGTVQINNCTFQGNVATGGPGGVGNSQTFFAGGGNGDGAAACSFGSMTVDSATISGNTGTGGAGAGTRFRHGPNGGGNGGVAAQAGLTGIASTIVAGNTGSSAPDAEGTFTSDGFNLIGIGDQSTGWKSGSNDQVGTAASPLNPHLGPLANNGGPTDTMVLLYGSTAIDAGYTSLTSDQRGISRPIDTIFDNRGYYGADIGAVEMNLLGGIDTDGDGMSDDYERFYGLNPNNSADGSVDTDGDGLTNAQEFKAGTNPLDSASEFHTIQVAKNGNDFANTFQITISGKMYRLERKDVLDTSPTNVWTNITGLPDFTATSVGTATITDQGGATATKRFYRVRVLP